MENINLHLRISFGFLGIFQWISPDKQFKNVVVAVRSLGLATGIEDPTFACCHGVDFVAQIITDSPQPRDVSLQFSGLKMLKQKDLRVEAREYCRLSVSNLSWQGP